MSNPKPSDKNPEWLKKMLIRSHCGCVRADCAAHGSYDPDDVALFQLLIAEDVELQTLKRQQYERRCELADDPGAPLAPITGLKLDPDKL